MHLAQRALLLGVLAATPQEFGDDERDEKIEQYRTAVERYTSVLERSGPLDRLVLVAAHSYRGNANYWLYWLERESRSEKRQDESTLHAAIADQEMALALSTGDDAYNVWERWARDELAAMYRDELKDFDTAEHHFRALIELEPDNPGRYYALADLYEQFHDPENMPLLDQALELVKIPVQMFPDDPKSYRQVASTLAKYGRFEETVEWLSMARDARPDDPEGFYLIAVHYWDKVYRDTALTLHKRREYIASGLRELDDALVMRPDYVDALVYMSLLLREKAKVEDDPAIILRANYLRDKALAIRDRRTVSGH